MLQSRRTVKSTKLFFLFKKKMFYFIAVVKSDFYKIELVNKPLDFTRRKKKIDANRASASGSSVHIAG